MYKLERLFSEKLYSEKLYNESLCKDISIYLCMHWINPLSLNSYKDKTG